jgi:membrane associated rhomboid family serine protease
MLFPFKDNIPSRIYPIVNIFLIWINILIFLYESSLGDRLGDFLQVWGLIPAQVTGNVDPGSQGIVLPFFSAMFLHGSWFHLLSNVWFLYLFGDNVEDRLGHWRYLWFYLFAGLVAALAHVASAPESSIPTIGASGAIAGVLGAYIILYPKARVAVFVWFVFFIDVFELPAMTFLGFWFLTQVVSGLFSIPMGEMGGGIAWWAHVGGFLAGALFIRFLCQECELKRHPEDPRPYYR